MSARESAEVLMAGDYHDFSPPDVMPLEARDIVDKWTEWLRPMPIRRLTTWQRIKFWALGIVD